jgi:predicted RNA-binding Zn ribbon-like protein
MNLDRPPAFFIAQHPALDFLNTIATPKDVPIEWLGDGRDLVDWLERAGMIEAAVASALRASKNPQKLDEVAKRAREFRQWLRAFVTRYMGKPIPRGAVKALGPLNKLLANGDSYQVVEAGSDGHPLRLRNIRKWASAGEVLQPLAEAAADLVCHEDFRLIRACGRPPCTLLFLDRTKAHARRWCSMAVCGNRAKAAAHRARRARKQPRDGSRHREM